MSSNKGSLYVYRSEVEAPLPTWPVTMAIVLYPLWFLLGVTVFMWIVLAAPMAISLIRSRRVSVPRGFGLWLIFMIAALGSSLSVDTFSRVVGFTLRYGYYLGATVFLIYLLNGARTVSVWHIVRVFTYFWMTVVIGGYLGFILGDFSFRSPMAYFLPGGLLENDLIKTLVNPGFADIQNIVGLPIPRPKAPFPYTNSWGSMLALLTPFAFMAASDRRVGINQNVVRVLLFASLIPGIVSLNRGLWLSLGVAILYVTFRLAAEGEKKVISRFIVFFVVVAALFFLTPLGDLITTRILEGHSNEDRASLARSAFEGSLERPLFGWGVPRPNVRNLPPIGTHGQLWNLLFTHGFIGAIGWISALVVFFFTTFKQKTIVGMWSHAVILIALVQLPFYLQVPHQIFTVMAGVAIAVRMLPEDSPSEIAKKSQLIKQEEVVA